jgi:hypothetical protein
MQLSLVAVGSCCYNSVTFERINSSYRIQLRGTYWLKKENGLPRISVSKNEFEMQEQYK